MMRAGRALEVQECGDPAGHPAFFFHGLIGSHHQASYIAEPARENGLRIIAPNRPGVGRSEFVDRKSPLEAVADVEDVAAALDWGNSASSASPAVLLTPLPACTGSRTGSPRSRSSAAWDRRRCPGAGMDRRRRMALELGAVTRDSPAGDSEMVRQVQCRPRAFLDRLIAT